MVARCPRPQTSNCRAGTVTRVPYAPYHPVHSIAYGRAQNRFGKQFRGDQPQHQLFAREVTPPIELSVNLDALHEAQYLEVHSRWDPRLFAALLPYTVLEQGRNVSWVHVRFAVLHGEFLGDDALWTVKIRSYL
ncbi:MAG: hypothetical protein Q9184_003856 [Pyrenodesmia sp. 2 TL-2023]